MRQEITFHGTPITVGGQLPKTGDTLLEFKLVDAGLENKRLRDFSGKRKILNIFPSLDTPTCAQSVRQFNERVNALDNVVLLQISADLPFAHSRFCSAEGLENGVTLSIMREKRFAGDYGVLIEDGPLEGLCARAVIVADEQDKVLYSELVPEIGQEPDYDAAMAALNA